MKIVTWNKLNIYEQRKILARPELSSESTIKDKVTEIIQRVRLEGDPALSEFTAQYDNAELTEFRVTKKEFLEAQKLLNPTILDSINFAKNNIEINHRAQFPKTKITRISDGVIIRREARPINRVGLYIPGGTAPLVSTLLMLAIPAKIASCPLKMLCTPPDKNGNVNPYILAAAKLCGIESIYKIGGAQAIAAMAYGTKSIPKVDKIFGPGNAWVTQAKIIVSQDPKACAIDMPAGPSELMVIADSKANPDFVAADLLSQAEHGTNSQVMLIVLTEEFANKVKNSLETQIEELPRKDIVKVSLMYGRMIIVNNIEEAFFISNTYAPEHLILQVENPENYLDSIKNAGSVFLGLYAAETLGDYTTGCNHVLPTYGYARTYSGLSVLDFMKFINFQSVSQEGLEKIGPAAINIAEMEGLQAHANAVKIRLHEGFNL
jgi:histidinol dehydrogenase